MTVLKPAKHSPITDAEIRRIGKRYNVPWRLRIEAQAARIAELEAALREYEEAFCEGLCAEMPNIADHDCSGCRARAALGKDRAG